MRITLTGRRLALAAVLVLGGVAAPLAYATITDAGKAVNAPAQKPTRIVRPTVQTAPTAVGDPYQLVFGLTTTASTVCEYIIPNIGPFVLESLQVVSVPPGQRASSFTFGLAVKRTDGVNAKFNLWNVPIDSDGDGQLSFNLLVRPNLVGNAAVGDIYQMTYCIYNNLPGSTLYYNIILTGKSAPSSAPTPAQVSSFDATSGKTGATLQWKTASETEILGFNVWRYRGAKGVKVNRTLVRAKRSGEPKGASYRYVDQVRGAKRGLTYRLQLVDLKGKRTWYAAFAIASK
jgi:hypothetical protein